jgi:hypothetical protein
MLVPTLNYYSRHILGPGLNAFAEKDRRRVFKQVLQNVFFSLGQSSDSGQTESY